jgi:hypothetical protein
MPSLEVLDIGRNKVKKLPSEPGTLVNLRVWLPAPLPKCFDSSVNISGVLILQEQDHEITPLHG